MQIKNGVTMYFFNLFEAVLFEASYSLLWRDCPRQLEGLMWDGLDYLRKAHIDCLASDGARYRLRHPDEIVY